MGKSITVHRSDVPSNDNCPYEHTLFGGCGLTVSILLLAPVKKKWLVYLCFFRNLGADKDQVRGSVDKQTYVLGTATLRVAKDCFTFPYVSLKEKATIRTRSTPKTW